MVKTIRVRWLLIALFLIIIILDIIMPYIIRGGFLFVHEQHFETILEILLFAIGFIIYIFYNQEVKKHKIALDQLQKHHQSTEERLDEAFKYIGSINVQIQEIKSIFADLKIYPENKKELKYIMEFLGKKILSMINTDWVILRIIDLTNLKTLRETSICRGQALLLKHQFTNDDILNNGENLVDYNLFTSEQKSLNIKVFCIFPKKDKTKEQEVFIKAIISQLEMLFIIFTSNYYMNSNGNNK